MVHIDASYMIIALAILAHGLTARLPPWPWISWLALFTWLFTLILVLLAVCRRLWGGAP